MSASALEAPTLPALLGAQQSALLEQLTAELDSNSLLWISGYAAGLARARPAGVLPVAPVSASESSSVAQVTVIYGSQTGNARRLAESMVERLSQNGLNARLLRADAYDPRTLKDERYLLIVISTQGDGDPPDDARALYEFIISRRAPKLPKLNFGILGLGDSSYPQFCEIGKQLDARLEALGASRWLPRADADLDIETVADPWLAQALEHARSALKSPAQGATVTPLHRKQPSPPAHTRERPFLAEVLAQQSLSGRGSDKDIRHIELSLEGSGLSYKPGDALGVWPQNPPSLVTAVLQTLKLDGEQRVAVEGTELSLQEWLGSRRELTRLSRPFLLAHLQRSSADSAKRLLDGEAGEQLQALLGELQVIDLLQRWPAEWTAEQLLAALRPLSPRLYSIASSADVVGEEAHLTVAHVHYTQAGEARWGAASSFLARAAEGERVPVFIERNERFRLPADGSRDIIMIGPGTGVAPFRGFVQQRAASGASGRNWLFFGNPHQRSDFLYQTEWQQALQRGQLTRLDLAFSRDHVRSLDGSVASTQKVYVQQRLREAGCEIHAWLRGGAHLYVCGDASRMARDVHNTLIELLAEHGAQSHEQASAELNQLLAQGRYARDVY